MKLLASRLTRMHRLQYLISQTLTLIQSRVCATVPTRPHIHGIRSVKRCYDCDCFSLQSLAMVTNKHLSEYLHITTLICQFTI